MKEIAISTEIVIGMGKMVAIEFPRVESMERVERLRIERLRIERLRIERLRIERLRVLTECWKFPIAVLIVVDPTVLMIQSQDKSVAMAAFESLLVVLFE